MGQGEIVQPGGSGGVSAVRIVIFGKPIAQARPKFRSVRTKAGKSFGMAYNPQETEAGRFASLAATQLPAGFVPFAGAIRLKAVFWMPVPASTPKKQIQEIMSGTVRHTKKPDLDNLVKFAKDCLSGIVWVDDCRVAEISALKVYGGNPGTELIIEAI